MSDVNPVNPVDIFFSKLGSRLGMPLQVSPISIPISFQANISSPIEAYEAHIALLGREAVRVDVLDSDIIHICVWTSPGDLRKPHFIISTDSLSPQEQVYLTVEILQGRAQEYMRAPLESEPLTEHDLLLLESSKDDVYSFLDSIGAAATRKKISELYRQYITWATMNQAKPLSDMRFRSLAKQWLYSKQALSPIQTGEATQSDIVTTQAEESEFVQDIMKNEVLYKASLLETTVRRIAQNDPGVTALFLCGSAGLGKSYTVKQVLQEENVMDRVIWRTGAISGFTGLLQLLWDFRRGNVIVLDDNDKILSNENAVNILKGALNTKPADRVISYVRKKR